MTSRKLREKHARFVAEYLVDLNATQAAIRTGYSAKTAEVQGCRLLRNVQIAAAVAEGHRKQLNRLDITAERVLREVARIAFSDIRAHFDEHGNIKDIATLSDDTAAALASVEVVTRRRPGEEKQIEYVHKIRLWDKVSALEKAMKHLGMLKDTVRLEGTIPPFILKMEG